MAFTRIGRVETGGAHRLQADRDLNGGIIIVSNAGGTFLSRVDGGGSVATVLASPSLGQFSSGFVETLSNGRYAIYTTFHFGLGQGSRVQILNRDGSAFTDIVNPMFEDSDRSGSGYTLAATSDGGFAFVWNDHSRASDAFTVTYPQDLNGNTQTQSAAGSDVRVRYFDDDALATGASTVADDDVESLNGATASRRTQDQYINDTEILAGGQTAYAYYDQRWSGASGGGASSEGQLSLQISTPGNVGEPIQVDLGTFGQPFGSYPQSVDGSLGANVVALPNGTLAVIWSETTYVPAPVFGGYTPSGSQTYIRYYNAAGTALTDPIGIVTRGTAHGNHSRYVWGEALADGRIVIAYNIGVDGVNGNGTLDAFIGILGPLGSTLEVTQVNAPASNAEFFRISDLVVRTDGTMDLVYLDPDDGNQTVIERFSLTGPGETAQVGAAGADTFAGTGGDDQYFALEGNDILNGNAGNDSLYGQEDDDTIDGGAGADSMFGGGGNDLFIVDSSTDLVVESAGGGTDTVRTAIGDKNAPAYALYYIPDNVENLVATSDAGQGVGGNVLNNVVTAGSGADLIAMHQGGVDNVNAAAGADYIWFGDTLTGADVVNGGLGRDTLAILGPYASLTLGANVTNIERLELFSSATPFTYTITLADSVNAPHPNFFEVVALSLTSSEHLVFDGSSDTDSRYFIRGGAGNDTLRAGSGNDRIVGNDGNDQLFGNAGNDVLAGGNGQDTYDTGAGADVVEVLSAAQSTSTGHDIIAAGFDASVDRINVSGTFTGWGAAQSGALSTATFDAQLAAAVNAALGNNQAVRFTANAGDQNGKTFVIYDANGDGSYTAGTDYVFEFVSPAANLESHTIFV